MHRRLSFAIQFRGEIIKGRGLQIELLPIWWKLRVDLGYCPYVWIGPFKVMAFSFAS